MHLQDGDPATTLRGFDVAWRGSVVCRQTSLSCRGPPTEPYFASVDAGSSSSFYGFKQRHLVWFTLTAPIASAPALARQRRRAVQVRAAP